jgi:hypothetical protein
MLKNPNEESHKYPCMLLGLFSREKLVKGNRITYDEKRFLWDAFK